MEYQYREYYTVVLAHSLCFCGVTVKARMVGSQANVLVKLQTLQFHNYNISNISDMCYRHWLYTLQVGKQNNLDFKYIARPSCIMLA